MTPELDKYTMDLRHLTVAVVTSTIAAKPHIENIPGLIKEVFTTLQNLGQPEEKPPMVEVDLSTGAVKAVPEYTPAEVKKSIGKDAVTCLICGTKMRVLTKHLREAHNLTPAGYRNQFGISKTQALAARSLSDAKRQQAKDLNLAGNLRKTGTISAPKAKKSQSKGGKAQAIHAAKPPVRTKVQPDLGLD